MHGRILGLAELYCVITINVQIFIDVVGLTMAGSEQPSVAILQK